MIKKIHGVTHTHPKHRVLITFVLLLSLLLTFKVFMSLNAIYGMAPAFLFSLAFGLLINVLYQFYHFRHCKGRYTRINTLTQIWFGSIAILASIIALLIEGIFNLDIIDILLVYVAIVLVTIFVFIKHYDDFLEHHTKDFKI